MCGPFNRCQFYLLLKPFKTLSLHINFLYLVKANSTCSHCHNPRGYNHPSSISYFFFLFTFSKNLTGVATMTQWIKYPTAVAWVAAETWVQSPALCSGLKDLALWQRQCRSQLRLIFSPGLKTSM